LLPINVNKIVVAKFGFNIAIYLMSSVFFTGLSIIYSIYFNYQISWELTLFQFFLGFALINFSVCGYYLFGGENMLYVTALGFLFIAIGTKQIHTLTTVLAYIIIPIISIVCSGVFAILACKAFKANKPLWDINLGRKRKGDYYERT
jgi:hypothetical protein